MAGAELLLAGGVDEVGGALVLVVRLFWPPAGAVDRAVVWLFFGFWVVCSRAGSVVSTLLPTGWLVRVVGDEEWDAVPGRVDVLGSGPAGEPPGLACAR